jgi:hypothetical protein
MNFLSFQARGAIDSGTLAHISPNLIWKVHISQSNSYHVP